MAVAATETPPYVPPLSPEERALALRTSDYCAHQADYFTAWYKKENIVRGTGERDVDFARRAFLLVHQSFRYLIKPGDERALRATIETRQACCDDLSNVFVAVLRANGVPARCAAGWPAEAVKPNDKGVCIGHVKAEFFADGIGWVPVEMAGGVGWRDHHGAGDANFGCDDGTFLVTHVDCDFQLNDPHFGRHIFRYMTHCDFFMRGSGDLDQEKCTQSWEVRKLP